MMEPYNEAMSQMAGQAIGAMTNYAKIWTDFMTSMALAGLSSTPGATPPEAARQVRGSIFRTMAEAMEDSMRTPQYMEMMRASMDAMLNWRKQLDGMMTQARQAMQGTTREDVDTLMVTIRHMERRILDRLEDMTERMDDLEDRMDRATGNGHEEAPRRSRRSSRRETGRTEREA